MIFKAMKLTWKKVWYFIWDDDSIWSWIVNIILAFVLIKYLIYPVLGFMLGTGYPIVAVVSGSMEHDGSFDEWWHSPAICDKRICTQEEYYKQYNIDKEMFQDFKYKNGFNTGDIMVLYGTKPKNLKIGDTLVFKSSRPDPIIHRIINIKEVNGQYTYQTKGDHNPKSMESMIDEVHISENQVLGRAVFRIPLLGYVKIGFVKLIQFIGGMFI